MVWNFPYPEGFPVAPSASGAALILRFLECVGNVLAKDGQVWLTLAQGQGGSTREVACSQSIRPPSASRTSDEGHSRRWDLEALALKSGYVLQEVSGHASLQQAALLFC